MRDKIVFFVLGAVVATIAYFIGDLETLTAEDEFLEIDFLRVNRLHVKESIVVKESIAVGGTGKSVIVIMADNERAEISMFGAEVPENRDDVIDPPSISLIARGDSAVIRAESRHNHNEKHPEAACLLGVTRPEGKYKSWLILDDSDGIKSVLSAPTD